MLARVGHLGFAVNFNAVSYFQSLFSLLIWLFVSSFFCQVLTASESSALSNTNPEGNVEDESKWSFIISPASNFELQLHYPSMMHDAT